jgi:hypothetical protein
VQFCFSESWIEVLVEVRIGRAHVVLHLVQVVCQADQSTHLSMRSCYEIKDPIHTISIYITRKCVSPVLHRKLSESSVPRLATEDKA